MMFLIGAIHAIVMIAMMILVEMRQAVPQMAAVFFVTPVVVRAKWSARPMIAARLLQHIERVNRGQTCGVTADVIGRPTALGSVCAIKSTVWSITVESSGCWCRLALVPEA